MEIFARILLQCFRSPKEALPCFGTRLYGSQFRRALSSSSFLCFFLLWGMSSTSAPFLHAASQGERGHVDSLLHALAKTPPNSEQHVRTLLELSLGYNTYKPDSAILVSRRAMGMAEKIQFPFGIAEGLRTEALGQQRIGHFTDATRLYLQALPLFEKLSDTLGLANTFNGLGISYFEQADFTNALQFYQKAEPLYLRLNNMARYCSVLANIGYVYAEMNYVGLAEAYTQQSIAVAEKYDVNVIRMFSATTKADIFRRRGLIDSAVAYLQKSRTLADVMTGNIFTRSRMHFIWGMTLIQAKQFAEAQKHLDTSLLLATQANMRFRMRDAYKGFQILYEAQQDFRQAYGFQGIVARYNDSLFNQESARQIASMQREVESRTQNERIELLQKENGLQQRERNIIIGVALVLFGAGLGLIQAFRRTRATNERLQVQNANVSRQKEELAQKTSEIAVINTELQQKNTRLLALNDEKNHFLAIAAHDLKNPLTGIRSLSDYLGFAELPKAEVQLLGNRISQTAERMFTLVQNLLDINAIENGGIELAICTFDITSVVENVVQQYMDVAIQKDITLRYTVQSARNDAAQGSFFVQADEQYMVQILDNIVSNAIKYSPLGKQVFIRVLRNASCVRIEVQDEGQGLSDEDKQHLFGKFTKLSARPTGGEHSTGLGLSIAKQLVEMMHGTIWCESEYLHGATFILEFPQGVESLELQS